MKTVAREGKKVLGRNIQFGKRTYERGRWGGAGEGREGFKNNIEDLTAREEGDEKEWWLK